MFPKVQKPILGAHWGTYEGQMEDGALVGLKPIAEDPNPSPIADGMIDAQEAPSRVARPSLRKGFLDRVTGGGTDDGDGRGYEPFVELPWDEALDIAASEIERIRSAHGNQAIFGGSYGWASAGRFHHAQSQVHRFLNAVGGYTRSVQNYSYGAGEVIVGRVLGDKRGLASGHTSWPVIVENTKTLVLFGGLPKKNAQVNAGGVSRHMLQEYLAQAAANGARIVSISPVRDDTVGDAVEWWPIRPGTDVALMLAIGHVLISAGRHDQEFLNRCTTGFDQLRAYIMGESDGIPKTPAWAAEITELSAEDIVDLANAMSTNRNFIMTSWAMQRAQYGEQTYWMTIALASILGQIGLPGGGFGFGYASVNGIGEPARTAGVPALSQLSNPVSEYIPVARIADCLLHPGEAYDYDGQTRDYPDLRMIYWAGGNPFHHHQDLNRLRRAWQTPETIIVNESFWTATARHADIVFPTATALERNDIVTSGRDRFLTPSHQMRAPFGESRSDYEIFAALSARLGAEEVYTEGRDEESWLRMMYDSARASNSSGLEIPDFETFWTGAPIMLEPTEAALSQNLYAEFRADPEGNALKTPSGKIELYSETIAAFGYDDCQGHPMFYEPDEWLGSEATEHFPLHLISNQPKTKLHSQYDAGSHARADKIQDRERLRMHPDDAAARGLQSGQIVRIFNDRGACLAGLEISDEIRPSVAQISTGAWFDPDDSGTGLPEKHGNPNVLTRDRGTSRLAQATAAMSCLVEIEAYEGTAPELSVFLPPKFHNTKNGKEIK